MRVVRMRADRACDGWETLRDGQHLVVRRTRVQIVTMWPRRGVGARHHGVQLGRKIRKVEMAVVSTSMVFRLSRLPGST